MPVPQYLLDVIQEQETLVLEINTEEVNESAKLIAFYSAMIDAAIDDPFEDEADQDEMIQHLTTTLKEHVEHYQELVNNEL